jgi:hypothetical protein
VDPPLWQASMVSERHIVLVNQELSGLEYGMLQDFQDEIARLTGAMGVPVPPSGRLTKRFGLGTRYSRLRRFISQGGFYPAADVLWTVLMGPEDYTPLDVFKEWDRRAGFKILYLFDTMERQLSSIRAILRSAKWDLTITSFQGAVPFLEAQTQRRWFAVPQGVKLERFRLGAAQNRVIDFSAYGRRLRNVHESVKRFCAETGHYYEYTTTSRLMPGIDAREQYDQYAWRLRHSVFNFCWPVETTNPDRVRTFSPITCRWFEAAASGTVVVGQPPKDPGFPEMFGEDFVVPLAPQCNDDELIPFWSRLVEGRDAHLEAARRRYLKLSDNWSWERRIKDILGTAGLAAPNNKSENREGFMESACRG